MPTNLTALDNAMWNCLSQDHARYAVGKGATRRYARGFSPILGFADPQAPDFEGLASFADPGEQFYCEQWTGVAPPGWQVVGDAKMLRMWDTGRVAMPDASLDVPVVGQLRALHAQDPADAERALELALLTRPGPFGPRTLELGDYVGVFVDDTLIAMAGERMQMGSWREISGVCCRPGYTGRGLARLLMQRLLRQQRARGERTFLQVMSTNDRARALYERLGFEVYREIAVRIVERMAAPHATI
jgi:ribosomal protein S18 acetylase RimI-like enzyme